MKSSRFEFGLGFWALEVSQISRKAAKRGRFFMILKLCLRLIRAISKYVGEEGGRIFRKMVSRNVKLTRALRPEAIFALC